MSEFTSKDRMMLQKTYTLLEAHIEKSDERHVAANSRLKDHEKRIRSGERFRYSLLGWAAAAGGSAAGFIELIRSKFIG